MGNPHAFKFNTTRSSSEEKNNTPYGNNLKLIIPNRETTIILGDKVENTKQNSK